MLTEVEYVPSSRRLRVVTEDGSPGWVIVPPGAGTAPGFTEYANVMSALCVALSRPGSQTAVRRPRASYAISVTRPLTSTFFSGRPRSGSRLEVTVHVWCWVEVTLVGLVLPPALVHLGA